MHDIYKGPRDEGFKDVIKRVLEKGRLTQQYMDMLMNDESMVEYDKVFTSASANPSANYERYELLGDSTLTKFIVWYSYKRFPQLEHPEGVKIVARLKIKYGSRAFLSSVAMSFGFWDYITAKESGNQKKVKYRQTHRDELLEDVFEAFIGCTESLIDQKTKIHGIGYIIIYSIMSSIMDNIDMSLKYEDLHDAKSRLKETFELYKDKLGDWNILTTHNDTEYTSIVYRIPKGINKYPITKERRRIVNGVEETYKEEIPRAEWVELCRATGVSNSNAEQVASEKCLSVLKTQGFAKLPPTEYTTFSL